jgi:hypothetical protein
MIQNKNLEKEIKFCGLLFGLILSILPYIFELSILYQIQTGNVDNNSAEEKDIFLFFLTYFLVTIFPMFFLTFFIAIIS